jgi:hypothetical protein
LSTNPSGGYYFEGPGLYSPFAESRALMNEDLRKNPSDANATCCRLSAVLYSIHGRPVPEPRHKLPSESHSRGLRNRFEIQGTLNQAVPDSGRQLRGCLFFFGKQQLGSCLMHYGMIA